MNGKERILAVLNGQTPDRVPVCPFVQQEYLNDFFGRTDCTRVVDAVKLSEILDFDVFTRDTYHIEPHYMRQSYPNWEVEKKESIQNGIVNRVLSITTPEGVLSQREVAPYDPTTIGGIHFSTKEYLLSDIDRDYPIFKKYMPTPSQEYIDDMHAHAKWAESIVGTRGINCPWGTGGVYNTASTLRNVEDLMCDPYDDEDLYDDMMTFLSDMIARDYGWMCDTDYQIFGMQGNIANAGMLSLTFFEDYVMPYEEKITQLVASRGKHTLYHNCGIATGLYPAYQNMHMTLFETLSPAPQGDNDLAKAKSFFGTGKVLAGNLDQIHFLKTATPDEVASATKRVVEIGKVDAHYLFACSDFLEKNTPTQNVKAMIEAAKEAGKY